MRFVKYDGDDNFYGSELAAISSDGRAVRWIASKSKWMPGEPSCKLAEQIIANPSSVELTPEEIENVEWLLGPYRDLNRRFDAYERSLEKWEGWITVALMFAPGIPLWWYWEDIEMWSGGYGAPIAGIVIYLQFGLIWLFRDRLSHWIAGRAKLKELI